ncbi:MAG TPA: SRPBCC family protein [Vicinamibacteria bacterium]|jgi:activator of HSP90 ATPase|nr:SRPBCC family protein [Vicinamibacteria bacterium]
MNENVKPRVVTLVSARSRGLVISGAILLGGLATVGLGPGPRPKPSAEDKAVEAASASISIHQEIDLNASPQRVYEALLDAKQFNTFSGLPAEIHREAGGDFSCFGGHIVGRNVELVPNQRIVQAWRAVGWPEGAYSIAKFELKAQGSGTRVILDHRGFPEGLKDHLAQGWKEHYWDNLTKYFP